MKNGIHIQARSVRVLVMVLAALIGVAAVREYPEVHRYLNTERM